MAQHAKIIVAINHIIFVINTILLLLLILFAGIILMMRPEGIRLNAQFEKSNITMLSPLAWNYFLYFPIGIFVVLQLCGYASLILLRLHPFVIKHNIILNISLLIFELLILLPTTISLMLTFCRLD